MRILMVGDVVGRPGRRGVQRYLPELCQQHRVDFVIANGENAAGGRGITPATAAELFSAGVDVITTGNHVWDQKESRDYLAQDVLVIRPLNYPQGVPGRGSLVHKGVRVVNLTGRVFLDPVDSPFQAIDRLLEENDAQSPIIIVDFHAEASSEKQALAWYLDGRVSAVLGTHTHVPTADGRVLPKGTAYVGDVGMVGPWNSIIGAKPEPVISHFLTQLPAHFDIADGPIVFNAVLIEIDPLSGGAISIERLDAVLEEKRVA
ncbi:MAG: TIGR00282 family metallophosphoesterase [Bacteroidetes bacterium]|nr:TIGR00282 family metallophosphoesterase [Bacteroidota bacterium]MCL5025533.1 TIGR00282 family metallophosphoesterase [Chloroflexota bacterium]